MSTGSTTAVMYIAFSSDELSSSQVTDYLDRVINPQLFTINGVSKVDMYGGIKYALRVWLDPLKMAAYDLTATEIMGVLNSNNYQSATGQAIGEFVLYNGNADTRPLKLSNYIGHIDIWPSESSNYLVISISAP